MTKPYTHSYSSLKLYKLCPKQYHATYIAKSVKRGTSPALEKGIRMHKHMEDAVSKGTELPKTLTNWTPLTSLLRKAGAKVEKELAITKKGEDTSFWGKDAHLRGKVDVVIENRVIDWKSGQVRPDTFQADVYQVLMGVPIDFSLVFLEHSTVIKINPDEHAAHRVHSTIEQIERDKEFITKPSYLCRWCPVTTCKYNGG